jgi:formylglycine-generating enzyme required for sulfatase activity
MGRLVDKVSEQKAVEPTAADIAVPAVVLRRRPIAFDWVTIPAGDFLMGSDKSKDRLAFDDEMPQHILYLPEFRIARVPVTVAQFAAFVKAAGFETKANQDARDKAEHPITRVSWYDAVEFCRWAGVRLPTEAEWEKAARGTDGRIWPWGTDPPTEKLCNFNLNVKDTTPVRRYPEGVSEYGLLDMAGNVWEWTSSLFKPYRYDAGDGREDLGSDGGRTLRGGSFLDTAQDVRCASRWDFPLDRDDDIGFRVVSLGS